MIADLEAAFGRSTTYMDANGGITVSKKVRREIKTYFDLANPSNTFTREGLAAARRCEEAEKRIFDALGMSKEKWRLISTSGSTESIATAIMNGCRYGRIIIMEGNHPCVEAIEANWKYQYGSKPRFDRCEANVEAMMTLLRSDPDIRSIFITHVDSLHGAIADVEKISEAFKFERPNGLVIVDSTQAIGKGILVPMKNTDVIIFSGHKFGALKGIGMMFVDRSIDWIPLIPGTQQDGLRGGTINVQGILSTATALEETMTDIEEKVAVTKHCVDSLAAGIDRLKLPRVRRAMTKLPTTGLTLLYNVPVCSRRLAQSLSTAGFGIGIGSACQTEASDAPYLIRLSLHPGETIAYDRFIIAFSRAYNEVIESLASSIV